MNPAILFAILLVLAAAVMLRLQDRTLVRLLGGATLLVGGPAIILMTVLNWRVELGAQPTVLGYALVSLAAVGCVFLAAALLTSVLRVFFPRRDDVVGVPAVKVSVTVAKKIAAASEKVLDTKAV